MKKTIYIKYLLVLMAISSIVFAETDTQVPDGALRVKVKAVMMGDLMVVDTPEGLDEVWLMCADAPKLKPTGASEYMAIQARNFTRREVAGKEIWLDFDNPRNTPRRDGDGHLMAYVYYTRQNPDGSAGKTALLNEELIRNGLAKVDNTYSCGKRADMNETQKIAKNAKIGIWSVQPQ